MPVLFNRVEKGNPRNSAAPKKWHPVIKTLSRIMEKGVAKEISDETTLNHKEAEMALSQLEKVLIRNLLSSNSVQIGDWGTFYLTCNSVGADTKEEVTAKQIKSLNVRFLPGKSLKKAIADATFMPAENVLSKRQS